jgi:hypothetical protein
MGRFSMPTYVGLVKFSHQSVITMKESGIERADIHGPHSDHDHAGAARDEWKQVLRKTAGKCK